MLLTFEIKYKIQNTKHKRKTTTKELRHIIVGGIKEIK